MLHVLQRHPIPVVAKFQFSLVLAYAYPAEILQPLLPPGLELDRFDEYGIVAIAMVQTRGLRPVFLPALAGQDFFLTGYRIFVRHRGRDGRTRRGLRILRSDTDNRLMAFAGNRLTHYNYRVAKVNWRRERQSLRIDIHTPRAEADVAITADLSNDAPLPAESPFPDLTTARRFAGPLPYTFDYEPQTHSIIRIKGVRQHWEPQPIRVTVTRATFLQQPPFDRAPPRLANAFLVQDVPYRWERGKREPLE